jgi:glycosyltransferase involved in cell wall biosynthesis
VRTSILGLCLLFSLLLGCETHPAKTRTIRHGIDPEPFARITWAERNRLRADWGAVDDSLLIGTVGRLVPQKALHVLLDGFARYRALASKPSRLVVVGYGPLETEDGRVFEIETLRPAKDHFVVRLSGIRDRDAASALANTKLYVPRERLPEKPDDFFAKPDAIANEVFHLVGQDRSSWSFYAEVRPYAETW